MILRTVISLPKTRSSHPISKLLRPVLETKRLKTALGGVMSAVSVSFSSALLVAGVYQNSRSVQAFSPSITQAVIETEKQDYFHDFKSVVPSMNGVSQGFGRWHRGVDIMAPAGSKIYPVKTGKVLRIENARWGYGRSVLVGHGDDLYSLYAHLGKVMVEEGEVVDPDIVLAEVGLTGRTTGYHLHLEIESQDVAINPRTFLSTAVRLVNKN
jgi:murein DD-endopeptidase MepM/ murein hydrolase activator NlpD